jgi:uncharacterized protein (TIGR04255 family)
MVAIDDPLVAPPPAEVPLANAPLVRVIAQVRFPLVVAVEQREFIAPFQEAVRAKYPVLRQEQTQGVLLSPAGVAPVPAQTAWRFSDVEGHWRVSLTPDFLALETTSYTSRSDFLSRLREVVAALDEHVEPKLVDRLGVRYVDRIVGDAVNEIAKLVRPEVRGIAGTAAGSHALHALSESMFALDGARVLARWGRLPAGSTVDPAAIEPTNELSWILDLDMFSASPVPFSVDRVIQDATRFAERIYTFFRWAVTNDFLRRYGGNV